MWRRILVYIALYLVTAGIALSVFLLPPGEENDSLPVVRLIIIAFATVLLTKYFFYMVLSPWHDLYLALSRGKSEREKRPYEPKVSVLVPAWNEEDGVITTAIALLKSTYKNLEILVINNNSTDNTEANLRRLLRRYENTLKVGEPRIDLRYILERRQGKGHALNTGVAEARGDIIVSIDADCYVPPQTIENFVKCFEDPKVMAAVGNVKIGNKETILGVIQYLEFLFSFYFKKGDSLMGAIYIIGGAAGAFRKEVFEELGGYHTENITEDIELSVRIQNAGMKIAYAEDAVVYTEGATDLGGLIKQRLRWKRGRFETFLEYRNLFFSKDKRHNKMLSWVILPLAIFGDIQLSFEMFFLLFLYIYSYLAQDYSSFISGIIVVSSMFAVQVARDSGSRSWLRLVLLAPIGWLLLYVSTFVEFMALFKTFLGYLRGEKVKWQNWNRKGVFLSPDAVKES